MPHAPFIIASYTIAAVLLAWCAIAPVLHARKLKKDILRRVKQGESKNAPNA